MPATAQHEALQISSLPAAVEITLSSNLVWLDEETETHSGLSLCRHKAVVAQLEGGLHK